MAQVLTSDRPTDETLAASAPGTLDLRKLELARTVKAKLAQGYKLESQGDTDAVLLMRRPRRWFVFAGESKRYQIAVDEHGHASSRKI
jgi:hypothetical protein